MRVSGVRVSGVRVSGVRVSGVRVSGVRVSGVRVSGVRVSGVGEGRYKEPCFRSLLGIHWPISEAFEDRSSSGGDVRDRD